MTNIGTARRWTTLAILCLASLLLGVDMTVLHLAIPGLTKDLHPSSTEILWIADVYGFALAGLLITMGNLGDRIGRKKLLLIGTAAFGAASALTAYAGNPELLIAARALLGIAGATIMPSTLSIVRNVFTDPKERTTAISIAGGIGAGGFALGPIVGGALLDHFWWGSVFLINIPVMALILVLGIIVIPESRNPSPGRFDLVSVPLSIAGVMGVVYAVTEYSHAPFAQVALVGAVGIVVLAVFARRRTRLASPLIDIKLFRRRAFSASVGANVVVTFAMVAQSLIFAQYFQLVLGWSPLKAGLAVLPGAGTAVLTGGMAAVLIPKIGRNGVVSLGMLLAAVGAGLYTVTGTALAYWTLLPPMALVGAGMGFTFAVTADTMLAVVPRERAGAASAISETGQELGGALGMAILGSLLNSAYRGGVHLPAGLPPEAARGTRDSLGGALTAAGRLPSSAADQVLGAAKHAFVGAMHEVALTSAGLLAVVAVTTLFTLRGLPAVFPSDVDADVADADAGVADADAGVADADAGVADADADAGVADADASDAAEACGEFAVS